jgi:hypothetical protein
MADEVKNLFGGFDAVMDQLIPSGGNRNIEDDDLPEVNPEDVKKSMESLDTKKKVQDDDSEKVPADKKIKKEEPIIKPKKVIEETEEEESDEEIEEEEVEETITSKKKKSDIKEEESEEIDLEEKEIVEAFSDLFAEELGWKYEKDEKPTNIKDLVKHMQSIVDEASQPRYANDEVRELDEFVKDGGRVADFYKTVYRSDVNTEGIDLTKEYNQKAVIKENLRNRGYSEQRIEKLISRYEETESLEEEAKDSLEEVKEFKEKTKKELLETQKNRQETEIKEQLNFVRNVEKIVKDKENIRGIPISDKQKKELLEYIFKPERDGSTRYQKDYSDSLENLVESAYFTKNRNTIVKEIQRKASSDAVKNLKLKLKTQGKSTKNTHSDMEEQGESKVSQLWEIASKELVSF